MSGGRQLELLNAELRLRSRQQAAVTALTRAAIAATGVESLFDQVLERAMTMLGMESGLIMELAESGTALLVRAARGWKETPVGLAEPLSNTRILALIESGVPLVLSNFTAPSSSPQAAAIRSCIATTIPGRERAWGTIVVHSAAVHALTSDDGEFLRVLANVLGLAIARDDTDSERRREAEMMHGIFDNIPVMISICDESGRIVRVNREWQNTLGWSQEDAKATDIFRDLYPDPRDYEEALVFRKRADRQWTDFRVRARDGRTAHAAWSRFRTSDGTSIGLGVDLTERARLLEHISAGRERQEALSRRLLMAQEEERRRLAIELHDELGQVLTAVKINLESLQRARGEPHLEATLHSMIRSVDDSLQRVRDIALDLRPSVLDDLGLPAALRWYADRITRDAGLEVHVSIDALPDVDIALATACFRVAQEALANVVRHAYARHVWLDLHLLADGFELRVRDDGRGFDVATARERAINGSSIGLLGMQERMALVGGEYDIVNLPGGGVEVRARFAVRDKTHNEIDPIIVS